MGAGQADAGIGQQQRAHLAPFQAFAHGEYADQYGDGRVDEQNQALERRRNVLQADEVEDARAVVAEQAQRDQQAPILARQRRRRAAQRQADPERDRQGEGHAQGQQRDRIHGRGGIGQFDENRLEGKTEGSEYRQRDAHTFGRPGFPRHRAESQRVVLKRMMSGV
ncbi:hypothetical protein FQZ97_1059930 [compost metagenome]